MSIFSLRKLLPIVVFFLFSGFAVWLWQAQISHERKLIVRHTQTSAEQIKIRIEGLMNSRIASLRLMADRWVERRPPDFRQQRFLGFAAILSKHYDGFLGIYWLDPDGIIQWGFPEETGITVLGRRIQDYPDPGCRTAFEKAAESSKPAMTPCVELYQGGTGFHIFLPLIYDDALQGYLSGVFLVEQIVEMSLPRAFAADFSIRINEDDRLVYRHGVDKGADDTNNRPYAQQEISFGGKTWQLHLEPISSLYSAFSAGGLLFLVFGFSLSGILSLLLYGLIQRMEMYRESRDIALREVNERKKVEEVLRENESQMRQLLAERDAKNEELESFVYTVSHDLRTPIVTVEGFIGALREDFGEILSGTGEKYLKYMSDATRKMELLINDLLNLSRIGRLTEEKGAFPLAELVSDSLDSLQSQIGAAGISVDIQENLPVIYGERKRLGQVMDNLLINAVKYIGRDNPAPRIDIGYQEKDGVDVFYVRDNGIGIEERYFDKIFQIFERLPHAKEVGDGTGIGLTIVKRIVEHHGGKIWLTSKLGKGTTFFFTLGKEEA